MKSVVLFFLVLLQAVSFLCAADEVIVDIFPASSNSSSNSTSNSNSSSIAEGEDVCAVCLKQIDTVDFEKWKSLAMRRDGLTDLTEEYGDQIPLVQMNSLASRSRRNADVIYCHLPYQNGSSDITELDMAKAQHRLHRKCMDNLLMQTHNDWFMRYSSLRHPKPEDFPVAGHNVSCPLCRESMAVKDLIIQGAPSYFLIPTNFSYYLEFYVVYTMYVGFMIGMLALHYYVLVVAAMVLKMIFHET